MTRGLPRAHHGHGQQHGRDTGRGGVQLLCVPQAMSCHTQNPRRPAKSPFSPRLCSSCDDRGFAPDTWTTRAVDARFRVARCGSDSLIKSKMTPSNFTLKELDHDGTELTAGQVRAPTKEVETLHRSMTAPFAP